MLSDSSGIISVHLTLDLKGTASPESRIPPESASLLPVLGDDCISHHRTDSFNWWTGAKNLFAPPLSVISPFECLFCSAPPLLLSSSLNDTVKFLGRLSLSSSSPKKQKSLPQKKKLLPFAPSFPISRLERARTLHLRERFCCLVPLCTRTLFLPWLVPCLCLRKIPPLSTQPSFLLSHQQPH